MVKVKRLGLVDYFKYRLETRTLKHLFSLTDSGYPRILALGYYHPYEGIVVCTVLNWEQREAHEVGHACGHGHVPISKVGYVMHPWGILRGNKW